ncbi:LOW QUALITY PROTEIN: hypothetical protein Q4I29_003674 [Leishmania shawi]|uniref:CULT domain-containing protein n=1 Tax=Leishmania shawi TaxID=5680 RepID=A0ABR3E7I8_9TRYP
MLCDCCHRTLHYSSFSSLFFAEGLVPLSPPSLSLPGPRLCTCAGARATQCPTRIGLSRLVAIRFVGERARASTVAALVSLCLSSAAAVCLVHLVQGVSVSLGGVLFCGAVYTIYQPIPAAATRLRAFPVIGPYFPFSILTLVAPLFGSSALMFMLMPHAFSPCGPPSGPSPQQHRHSGASGRRLAPLPPPLRTAPHQQGSAARAARDPTPPLSSALSSSSSTVIARGSAGSSSDPHRDGQHRLPPLPQLGSRTRHDAPPALPKRTVVDASVRRLFAGTAPAKRASRSGKSAGEVLVDDSTTTRPSSGETQRQLSLAVARQSMPQGLPKPRPLALQRRSGRAFGSDAAEPGKSRVAGTTPIDAVRLQPPAHPERNGQRHTSSGASLSTAANDAAATRSAPVGVPGAGCRPSAEQQNQQQRASNNPPYTLQDMNELVFTDPQNWKTEEELPGVVWSLLEGVALEAPYTSDLWTQAYVCPAGLLQAPKGNASALPAMCLHREGQQRTNGFYACVRCGTPVCDPSHQVIPASGSLRGIAVFDALNMSGVELRVAMPTVLDKAARLSREGCSSLTSIRVAISHDRPEGAAELDAIAGGLRFLVHCRHCNGCLGAMLLGEVKCAPSADAPRSSVLAVTSAASPATALFCANSVCLEYMPYRTHTRLDQAILDKPTSDSEAGSSGRRGGRASMLGGASAAVSVEPGATLGSLFIPQPRSLAWGVGEGVDGDRSGKQGGTSYAGDDTSLDSLLEELNPYGDSAPISSSDDSDD